MKAPRRHLSSPLHCVARGAPGARGRGSPGFARSTKPMVKSRRSSAVTAASASGVAETLAHVVGVCVVTGACVRSLPQILRIHKSRSAKGLSLGSFTWESIGLTLVLAYNVSREYPLSTYAECIALVIQDVIVACQIFYFRHGFAKSATPFALSAVGGVAMCATLFWWLPAQPFGAQALLSLNAAAGLIVNGSRLPQIVMNFKRGNTGELSWVTQALNVCGSIARIFTTLTLTQDILNLALQVTGLLLNGTLLAQCYRTIQMRRSGELVDDDVDAVVEEPKLA